jgi:hypothetical protein
VSPADVAEVAAAILGQSLTLAVVGPFDRTHTFGAVA